MLSIAHPIQLCTAHAAVIRVSGLILHKDCGFELGLRSHIKKGYIPDQGGQ